MLQPFLDIWRQRELFRAILTRELQVRFRGSVFGWAWAILAPLAMLSVYTLVFSGALKIDAARQDTGRFGYAFSIFVGLVVFNYFSEIAYRSPLLLAEHKHIIRRSIFPPQVLAWIAVARGGVYMLIALAVLLVGHVLINQSIHWSWLALPFVLLPLCLTLLGIVWLLSTIGALTGDLNHLIISIIPVAMFATPVFYEAANVPAGWRFALYCNPLTGIIEMMRAIILRGEWPDGLLYAASLAVSLVLFYGGRTLFMRKKAILVDII
ncbi:ABC transporter permease [Labrys monachus]|uniref:Transport permease protein n=1 Tax=Labrys monachus TaxID=217067 RepID=A0ABU0FCE1_9HYPH|nr:ABC transporter permease [Labrys monachus]MDQ0392260.1 lipopolysaccharide transport system permease protein [Labrys monachus]